jgi:hypothetical protein
MQALKAGCGEITDNSRQDISAYTASFVCGQERNDHHFTSAPVSEGVANNTTLVNANEAMELTCLDAESPGFDGDPNTGQPLDRDCVLTRHASQRHALRNIGVRCGSVSERLHEDLLMPKGRAEGRERRQMGMAPYRSRVRSSDLSGRHFSPSHAENAPTIENAATVAVSPGKSGT